MPVDKFGLSEDDDSITNFYPIRNYAINLDDLENVEGFDNPGKKDQMYGFRLNENRLYERSEIPPHIFDHGGIINKPLTFVYDSKMKNMIPISLTYSWDVDIKLETNKLYTGGANHLIHKIYNSGTIIGSLVAQQAVLKVINGQYFIASRENKEAHLEFKTEFDEDKKVIVDPPVGSSIIIDGRMLKLSKDDKDILPGLMISNSHQPRGVPVEFRIVLVKNDEVSYGIRFSTEGLQLIKPTDKKTEITPLKIHDFFLISRFRITTKPVTDDEIKYF